MRDDSLFLVSLGDRALPEDLVEDVLSHWPQSQRPPIERITTENLLTAPQCLKPARVVWLFSDESISGKDYEVLTTIQDQNVPAMLTRANETKPVGYPLQCGVIVGPAETESIALCASLRALWSQMELIREMEMEVRVIRAQRGGLSSQIDKIDEELRMAAQLQREFLPAELPDVKGVETHVLYRPASYVSGDIYDVVRLDEKHVGFFLADAVGHGVPAALLTVSIKRSLKTKIIDPTLPKGYELVQPGKALEMLNEELILQQSGRIRTATATYAVLNTETMQLRIARAGHPHPILLHPDGTTDTIEAEGAMLGVFPGEQMEEQTIQMQDGDRLLFYSDGFEVAFRGEHDKADRLARPDYTGEFQALYKGTVSQAIEMLQDKLDVQAGSLNQLDDMTAILVETKQVQEKVAVETPATALQKA